ncbi:hypothetical protein Hdeb2414_s0014g00432801 [Helianthus debilis subsp. tardiflorus]
MGKGCSLSATGPVLNHNQKFRNDGTENQSHLKLFGILVPPFRFKTGLVPNRIIS